MDATVLGYRGHQPDENLPRKGFMDYFALLVSLLLLAIPIGFVLLHLAICADIYIQARERALQAGEGQGQNGEEQEQDPERHPGVEGDPGRTDWYHYFADESSHLLPTVYEGGGADSES